MVVSVLVVAILALFISLAFCFASYRFFRLLIALWGFFVGFLLTTQALATSAGSHVLVSTAGVIIAVIVSLIVAALAYWLYVAAVVILSVSVGFWIGSRLMIAIGYGSHSIPALLIGMLVAVILALLTLALNLAKWLIILSTALGGASTIIAAVLLLLRMIPQTIFPWVLWEPSSEVRRSGAWSGSCSQAPGFLCKSGAHSGMPRTMRTLSSSRLGPLRDGKLPLCLSGSPGVLR